ncbi:uncharacterized protein [Watersipora subatra]|uniref:uncharacterized protein n=1 Tax=Watersipora subatra TaxID=2589382 RepID=UPI00355C9CD0
MDQKLFTLLHTVGCILLLVFAFLIICPVAIVLRNFSGHCIIGASVESITVTNLTVVQDNVSAHSKCTYPEFMGFAVLFFSVVYIVWNTILIVNSWQSPGKETFIGGIAAAIISFMLLVSSCIMSSGIARFCGELEDFGRSCEEVNNQPTKWMSYLNKDGQMVAYTTSKNFYSLLRITEAGSWLAFFTMLLVMIVHIIKLKTTPSGMEFMQSLQPESARIIGSDTPKRYDQI